MNKITHILKCSSLFLLALCGATTVCLAGAYLYLAPQLPEVETLREVKLQTPLRIYSEDKKLIAEYGEKRRTPISYEEVPPLFFKAILAAEDDRFYSHHGVDIKGLLRAAIQLIQSGHIQTGGSTITMQVAKNFFLSHERTFHRKFTEILLALQIERELTKEEILELYVNKIYLGNRAYGIQAASKVYYGTTIENLSIAQLAMIAGLPKAPSSYNPVVNPTRALTRRNWILKRMLTLDYINQNTYTEAHSEPVTAKYHGQKRELEAPYIAEMVRKELLDTMGKSIYTEGFNAYTTVKSDLQEAANQAVVNGLLAYDMRHGYRGPEQILGIMDETDISNEIPSEWLQRLEQTHSIQNLTPAIVLSVTNESASLLLQNGDLSVLNLENSKWARPYLSVNSVGKKPSSLNDILKQGYLIRVLFDEDSGQWLLRQLPEVQGALASIDPNNGALQALVGGFHFQSSKYNRATQAQRQPGSNFKPFIYTTALENGYTPASLINDAPVVFDDAQLENAWRPENYSGKFFGPTRLRQALYKSRNLVSIRLLRSITVPSAIEEISKYGFDQEKLPHDLSLALGSASMTPLDVASGFTAFANGGFRVNTFLIDSVEDLEGKTILEATPDYICAECLKNAEAEKEEGDKQGNELTTQTENNELDPIHAISSSSTDNDLTRDTEETNLTIPQETEFTHTTETTSSIETKEQQEPAERIISKRVHFIINSMLQDVIKKGTARKARALNRNDLAGKTGTTNDQVDAWFSGYNPDLVTTTWVGFDTPTTLGRREYGGTAALPIWIEYMGKALEGKPEHILEQPDGLVTVRIDPKTGLKANAGQTDAIFEIFRVENAPKEMSREDVTISPDELTETESPDEEIF